MNKPRIGEVVHYVLHDGPNQGKHRPAIVVENEGETLCVQVFANGSRNHGDEAPNVFWRHSVRQDAKGQIPGTWHHPEGATHASSLDNNLVG